MKGSRRELEVVARLYGIEPFYRDGTGQNHRADPFLLFRILKMLGAPVEGRADLPEALRWHRQDFQVRGLEPVEVLWEGKGRVPVRLASRELNSRMICRLRLENGTERSWPVQFRRSPILRFEGGSSLPWGYHSLTLETGRRSLQTLLISAPRRAYAPETPGKGWGVFLPLYALRRDADRGCGDLGDLEEVVGWVAKNGGRAVATLPLLPTFLGRPFEPSPYSPVSRLFWNELYLDLGEKAQDRLGAWVDYRKVWERQRKGLLKLSKCLARMPARPAFQKFLNRHPEVEDYARFRACSERQGKGWRHWPTRMREGNPTPEDYDDEVMRLYLYAQWRLYERMERLSRNTERRGVKLYLDFPLGAHREGYDVWRYRKLFVGGVTAGAPPDLTFTSGQNWDFPPLHPQRDREQGYAYLRAALRHHLQAAGILRIDHVMGLHRLFFIPEGAEPKSGVYVNYPREELYALLCLESHRHRCLIAGEDLGTVPPEVPPTMDRHGIYHLHVVQYELESRYPPFLRTPSRRSIASINNHDTVPFAAYWKGLDLKQRKGSRRREEKKKYLTRFLQKKGFLRPSPEKILKAPEIFKALLFYLASSAASWVLVNLEDLWQERIPQNIPASGIRRRNWRHKMLKTFENFCQDPQILATLQGVQSRRGSRER